MTFSELVEINPRVKLIKAHNYPFVEMGVVQPGKKLVKAGEVRAYKGGGSKFLSGDTLFARITPCLENGKIAQFNGHKGDVGFGSTEFFVFRARPRISDPDYVYYLSTSDYLRKPAERSMSGASGRQRADLNAIVNIEVPAPPFPTQRKIASILSAYDDLIENNLRRIKIMEEMAQNLYREWFVKFRFPGHENVRFVDSELGRIPEGWEVLQLGDVADQIRKNIKPKNVESGLPYIGLEHIPRRSITFTEWDVSDEVQSSKLLFKERDILFGKIRPYFHKIAVAPFDGICSTDTIVIRPKSFEVYFIVLGTTSSVEFIDHATVTSQGSKMPRANWSILAIYPVYMPTLEIMNQFNDFVGDIVKKLQTLLFTNLNLRQTRDLLLPKLISGEVDVSELNIETLQETPS